MHFLIAEGSSSSAVASSTSRVVIALGVADTATHRTYSFTRDECLLLLYVFTGRQTWQWVGDVLVGTSL